MRFTPTTNNISHPKYSNHSYIAKKFAEDVTLRYYSQGGTDKSYLEAYMMDKFEAVLEAISKDMDELWVKAWQATKGR